jgi:hypothetical protein
MKRASLALVLAAATAGYSEYNGAPLTANFQGTVTVPEFSVEGSFTATPAK